MKLQSLGSKTRLQEHLAHCVRLIRLAAKGLRVDPPIVEMAETMLRRPGKAPRLKLKAAETRFMVPVTLKVLELFFPRESLHDQLRYHMLSALNSIYVELANWSDETSGAKVCELARQHCIHYSALSREVSPPPWLVGCPEASDLRLA